MERKIFVCECHSLEHQVTFWYDEEEDSLFTEVHLITHKNFFKRVLVGIKYMFGYKSRFGQWDEFMFKPEDVIKLKEYVNKIS
jgi:hypothetical protein